MPEIEKRDNRAWSVDAHMNIPAMELPCFRTLIADQNCVTSQLLVQVMGGIGDYICAEPAIRYACENFRDTEVYVATYCPEFFKHLPVTIFDLRKDKVEWSKYYIFKSIYVGDEISCQFLTHIYSHVVDYHSLAMFRVQLSNKARCLQIQPSPDDYALADSHIKKETDVLVHAGRTWQSRTFSRDWWDGVLTHLIRLGLRPVLIGAESMNSCGTVDVNPEGCLDLRGRTSLMQSVAITHRARCLITNDSSPLHMAASGDAWIGYMSTVREPDTLLHYRNGGKQGWRMKNFSTNWVVNTLDMRPCNPELIAFNNHDPMGWLPQPQELADWAQSVVING